MDNFDLNDWNGEFDLPNNDNLVFVDQPEPVVDINNFVNIDPNLLGDIAAFQNDNPTQLFDGYEIIYDQASLTETWNNHRHEIVGVLDRMRVITYNTNKYTFVYIMSGTVQRTPNPRSLEGVVIPDNFVGDLRILLVSAIYAKILRSLKSRTNQLTGAVFTDYGRGNENRIPEPRANPFEGGDRTPDIHQGWFRRLRTNARYPERVTFNNVEPMFRVYYLPVGVENENDEINGIIQREGGNIVAGSSYHPVPLFNSWVHVMPGYAFFDVIRQMINQIHSYDPEYGVDIKDQHNVVKLKVELKLTRGNAYYRHDQGERGIPNFGGDKMFYKSIEPLVSYASNSYGIGFNNEFASGYCFSMAFMNSQYRVVSYVDHNLEWYESSSATLPMSDLMFANEIVIPAEFANLFNSPFSLRGVMYLPRPVHIPQTPGDLERWVKLAKIVHYHVENFEGTRVPIGYWNVTPQCYANTFMCMIHVYKWNRRGRYEVYIPANPDFWNMVHHKHVYLFIKNRHFYPIHDIRKFLGENRRKDQLCDYCQDFILGNQADCMKHVKECRKDKNLVQKHMRKFIDCALNDRPYHRYFPEMTKERYYTGNMICNVCYEKVPLVECGHDHECFVQAPKAKEPIANELIYALDMESMQEFVDGHGESVDKYAHICVLICIQNIYNRENRKTFHDIPSFVDFLLTPEMEDTTILAHNGGGYDYQFLIVEFEKRNIYYEKIPAPSSKHKYLQLTVFTGNNPTRPNNKRKIDRSGSLRFIDFMALVPGSLKGIAEAFKLPVQKGDFPHRFLNPTTLGYRGAIPPLDTEENFYSIKNKKSEEDIENLREWHARNSLVYCTCWNQPECTCEKRAWVAKDFLEEYCWLDVDVLSEAVLRYRELVLSFESDELTGWKASSNDPLHCVTQSQLAMKIYLRGWENAGEAKPEIYTVKTKERSGKCWQQYVYLESIQPIFDNGIIHGGNCTGNEYYVAELNIYVAGFHPPSNSCFLFYDCSKSFCSTCRIVYSDEERHKRDQLHLKLANMGYNLDIKYSHEMEFGEEKKEEGLVHVDRELFYGGRVEVFSAFADAERLGMDLNNHDVCSLYPYVCAFKPLPIGIPIYLMKKDVDLGRLDNHNPNKYFGFVKARIRCNRHDLVGLLPSRDESGRLVFDLNTKTGFWHTEEIYLALEHGYVIEEVYQVIHFVPSQVSDIALRGYVEYFLRMKQESEGWKKLGAASDDPGEEEKTIVINNLYESNGFIGRVRPEMVQINPVMRHIAKIFLNCLWGKFCQRQNKDVYCDITNYQEYHYIATDTRLDQNKMTFRQSSDSMWKVHYVKESQSVKPNNKYNIFIAASVTAHARCILHRQILMVGPERVLYCDTDSIIFLTPRGRGRDYLGTGLGKWTDEYKNDTIRIFFAFGPKSYYIVSNTTKWKSKGAWLTLENKALLTDANVRKLIYDSISGGVNGVPIQLNNMTIFPNTTDTRFAYATMMTRYNTKILQCTYTKRKVVFVETGETSQNYWDNIGRICLLPYGYES